MGDDDFLWLGNHPGLDLCNTQPTVDGRSRELLDDFDGVVRWARHAGIDVPAGLTRRSGGPETAERTWRWVRRLRDELRPLIDPTEPRDDVTALNAVLSQDRGSFQLQQADRPAVWVVAGDEMGQFRLDLAAAVLDVFSYDLSLVRRCHNPACVLLFLDVSKSRRRRWCDMKTCGNRAKAAAHYARTRAR
jgi:predicted RNA-binding Zn ribbon-like protein